MSKLSPAGQSVVEEISQRHGFSQDAVTQLLIALDQGGGSQAQFNHFELGGMGQWSLGGMTMIGDMFNNGLKARVDGLCTDLSNALAGTQMFEPLARAPRSSSHQSQSQGGGQMQFQGSGGMSPSSLFVSGSGSGSWWPEELGQPGSTGAQNDLKYAYFPDIARLAILLNGQATVYDTGAHQIGGFGQQQSGDQSLTFTSQFGLVRVADLTVVPTGEVENPAEPLAGGPDSGVELGFERPADTTNMSVDGATIPAATPAEEIVPPTTGSDAPPATTPASKPPLDASSIFETLEKLGDLRDKGILSETEFTEKKTELLARL